jgi:2-polyprenyl-3-methyl-5-hydroxy-6-metoxy-1,4-benzoquinol methylase
MNLPNSIRQTLTRLIRRQISFETHFNVPIKFKHKGSIVINERIVEIPFIFSSISLDNHTKKILDFGCTRSWLSLSLASLGHSVYGIDLRDFPFTHPNFVFQKINILDLQECDFDYIVSLSTLEHVGLGAYGEPHSQQALVDVVKKVHLLLKEDGTLLLTLPIGMPSEDIFEKSFAPEEILELFSSHAFHLIEERYFNRHKGIDWRPCTREEIALVSNSLQERNKFGSGVNGVGCFNFSKPQQDK